MTLALTEEQQALRKSVRRLFERQETLESVRTLMETDEAYDAGLWQRLATEIGVQGLSIPEEYGGNGGGLQELCYVMEECGKALAPSGLLATMGLAVPAIRAGGDTAAAGRYLPAIAEGSTLASVAWMPDGGSWTTAGTHVSVTETGDGPRLTGTLSYVLDGLSANLLLVVGGSSEELSLYAVDPQISEVSREALPPLDQTRPMARIMLNEAPAVLVGDRGSGRRILDSAVGIAQVLLASEMVGGAQACLDMSVDYAKIRHQFGRPIGSFQAIKHKCAEVHVAVEGARAAAYYAAWAATYNPDELPRVALIAKTAAAEAYFRAAAENIQIHGGIGFTWEHDAHLYFKRAESSRLIFGSTSELRRALADRLGV